MSGPNLVKCDSNYVMIICRQMSPWLYKDELSEDADQLLMTHPSIIDGLIDQWIDFNDQFLFF